MKLNLQPTLNWDIRMEPVTVNNSFDTGKKAIIRNDNNKLLGIVGKHYKPVTNAKLLYFTDALTESGEFKLMGFDELKEGKVTMAFLKNMNPNLKINGCTNDEFMFIGNSFDGTQRFHIGTGSSLHRCLNQFYSTLEIFSKNILLLLTTPILLLPISSKNIKLKRASSMNRLMACKLFVLTKVLLPALLRKYT